MRPAQILLVEDDRAAAALVEICLREYGYGLAGQTAVGEDAVRLAVETAPDLVLMDISLAGEMDGVAAAAQISEQTDVPVVYITAHADDETLQRAKGVGPFGFLLKPFRPRELHNAIEVALYKHQMERMLRESEKRFRDIVENSQEWIWEVDDEGRFQYSNPAVTHILGYRPENLAGTLLNELFHPDQRQELDDLARQILAGGKAFREVRCHCRHRDGHSVWLLVGGVPVFDEHGELTGYRGESRDLTEQHLAEEALRFTQFSMDHAVDAMGVIAPDAKFVYVNEAMTRNLGYTRAELLTMTVHDIDVLFSAAAWPAHWQDVKEKGLFALESYHRAKDGRTFPVEVTVNYLQFEGKEYNCAFARDVSERKEAEQRYRTLFETMGQGVIYLDGDGKIFSANPAAERLVGLPADQMLGRSQADLEWCVVHEDGTACPAADLPLAQALRNGREVADVVLGISNPPRDERRWISMTAIPQFAPGADWPHQVCGILHDLTEQRRAREQLLRSHRQLRALGSRLDEVREAERADLARELHDRLGQALTALSLNLNMVREGDGTDAGAVQERIDDSLTMVRELAAHVRNLMAELRPPVLDDYGLRSALEWYAKEFAKRAGIAVAVEGEHLSPRLPANVEMALFRICQEALTNVGKHASASKATISLKESNGDVRLSVADDGCGFHVESGADGKWGLITMRERAANVGVKLRVESTEGKGTRIVVEMKRAGL